jgi:hypothetical protein
MSHLDRRQLLKVAASTAAAAGLVAVDARSAAANESTAGDRLPPLPPVPGMHGDRVMNELWFEYEMVFYYQPSQQIQDAYKAVGDAFGGTVEQLYQVFRLTRQIGTYPEKFLSRVAPAASAYQVLSTAQLQILHRYCRTDSDLVRAFLLLGEGSLYDPRMADGFHVHMMNTGPNGEPPMNWHTWHAFNRAMTMLDISPRRWRRIDELVGMAWAVQSIAKPRPETLNPPLDRHIARSLHRQWSRMTPDELDTAFDSFPFPPGIG